MTLESKERLRNAVHSRLVRQKKSAKEIQEVLDSLKARPISYDEYKAMPQDVASWHEFANSANVDKALDAHKDEQKKAAQKEDTNISRMWTGRTSEEETAKCQATAEEFLSRYRHFVRIPENSTAIADRMRAKNLSPHDLRSFVRAFEELTVEGRLVLDGTVAGICDDNTVAGHTLRTHPQLHRFLQPTATPEQLERLEAAKMSADEYKKSCPELQDDGMPFAVQKRIYVVADSLKSLRPAYIDSESNNAKIIEYLNKSGLRFDLTGVLRAFDSLKDELDLKPTTAHAQAVTLTEYEPRETGAPKLPDKASLAAKIRNLSSTDLLKFYQENPGARAAVDLM